MNFEFSYPDIKKQCITMSYLNVISFCLLSGCGNIELPDEQELSQVYKLLKGTDSKKAPKNIAFMASLYKRCMPVYAEVPASPYDFKGFYWSDKKVKKEIEPDVLAFSIICMTALAAAVLDGEIKPDKKDFIAYCLGVSSVKQACFLADFLRFGDFFYSGKDNSDSAYGECSISIDNENPDLRTQFHVVEAISSLMSLLSRGNSFPKEQVPKLEKCIGIFPVICENAIENINDISSRELSLIGLSLLKTLEYNGTYRQTAYTTVNKIGCELCERMEKSGDISRNISDDNSSSFVTLCNSLNCLARLHDINPVTLYSDGCLRLYDRIDSYWDESSGLFLTSVKKKQKNNFKDIAAVICALDCLRCSLTDPDLFMHVDRQLSAFYGSAIIRSKLFNGQFYPILQENKMELHNLSASYKTNAPVFTGYFEVKPDKKKFSCEPGVFEAEDILSGCRYLLY